jgi:hypothetical protein
VIGIIFTTYVFIRNTGASSQIDRGKIFQIGFDKCGTVTLAEFFRKNGIAAVHRDNGKLAESIYQNHLQNKSLLNQEYLKYILFTDMEKIDMQQPLNIGMMLFKELDQQYPGSKFILNTRDKSAWLKSRALSRSTANSTLLTRTAIRQNKTEQQVLLQWAEEWDKHHRAVLEYFKDRPNDLIVFNIEKDPPQKLVDFFKKSYKLNPKLYLHLNRTADKVQK